MQMRRKSPLIDLFLLYRYGIPVPKVIPKVVRVEAEPWVCPGYTPPPKRKLSTVSDFDYNPVVSESSAARTLGQNSETLKKWRQRGKGPLFVQYGKNGAVRYSLSALKAFQGLPDKISIPGEDPPLNERDAAVILGVKPDTLKKWRRQNRGPAYRQVRGKSSAIRYRLSIIMAFRDANTVETRPFDSAPTRRS
jgi:transposase-like protein